MELGPAIFATGWSGNWSFETWTSGDCHGFAIEVVYLDPGF